MNANSVIESYVTDVAARLPRRQRNDVAFELRALLTEELQARADAAGRDADAAMAVEFVRQFGRPADVAARYRPTLTIIDPADGHRFLRVSVIGLVVIWCAGLLQHLQAHSGSGWDVLAVLGQWWGNIVIPSLWWPGVLVVGFGLSSWSRQRNPQTQEWKPRAAQSIQGGRTSTVMALLGVLIGVCLLVNPHWILDFLWGGNAAPAAYQALTYSDEFLQVKGPVLLALILLNVPLMIAIIASGRRSPRLQQIETGLNLLDCAAMLWVISGGPVLMTTASDTTAKGLMLLVVVFVLIHIGARMYRRVRPGPDGHVQLSQ